MKKHLFFYLMGVMLLAAACSEDEATQNETPLEELQENSVELSTTEVDFDDGTLTKAVYVMNGEEGGWYIASVTVDGEVLYRASDLLLDDRSSGAERFGRELAVFALSPIRSLTRIVTGDAWKRRATPGRHFGHPPLSVDLSLGARALMFHDADNRVKVGATARLGVEYGDRFGGDTRVPYDYFTLLMDLDVMPTQPVLSRIEIVGRLLSRQLIDSRACDLSIGLYQHFDYFDSDTINPGPAEGAFKPCHVPYKLGTPASAGVGAMLRYAATPRFALDAYAHVNGVLLGGVLSDFYRYYHRCYNWASGFSLKGGAQCAFDGGRLTLSVANQFYQLYSWSGYTSEEEWLERPTEKPGNVQGYPAKNQVYLWK